MVKYYDLNKPIPELNNLSLTQVFEGGNLTLMNDLELIRDDIYTHNVTDSTIAFEIINTIPNFFTPAFRFNFDYQPTNNSNFYLTFNAKSSRQEDYVLRYRTAFFDVFTTETINTTFNNKSFIFNSNDSITNYFYISRYNNYQIGDILTFNNIHLLDLTELGIDLTKEQMDYWFSIYQDSKGAVGSAFVQHAGIDTVIPNLNNKTLREVFEGGNVAVNYDFTNSTSGWAISGLSSSSLINQVLTINVASSRNDVFLYNQTNYPLSQFYFRAKLRVINGIDSVNNIRLRYYNGSTVEALSTTTKVENQWYEIGFKPTITGGSYSRIDVGLNTISATSNEVTYQIDGNYGIYSIDLTSLGIDTLTQAEMDYYFSLYQSWKQKTLYIGKSKNLFDKTTVTYDYGLNPTNGTSGVNTARDVSDFISVLPNTSYIGSGTYTQVAIAYYDSDKTFISGIITSNKSFTTPSNTAYMRFSINNDVSLDYDTIQLEQRTFATNYEQYYTPKTWIAPAFQQHALTDTKLIDTKLAYLNGYSIREVFENGNSYYGVDQGNSFSYNTIRVYSLFQNVELNDKIYINTNTYSKETIRVGVVNGSQTVWPITTPYYDSGWLSYDLHDIYTMTYTGSLTLNFSYPNNATLLVNDFNNLELNIYTINLTALGIDHLTQAELDQMFALYQDRNKNLFDENVAFTRNTISNTTGSLIATTSRILQSIDEMTPIKPSTSYYISINQPYSFAWNYYDSSKTFISQEAGSWTDGKVHTSPSNAVFGRLVLRFDDNRTFDVDEIYNMNVQIEEGSTATPYHAYGGFSLKDVFETGNLVTNGDFSDGTTGWNYIGSTISVENGVLDIVGTGTRNDPFVRSFLDLNASNDYYLSIDVKALNSDVNFFQYRLSNGVDASFAIQTLSNPTINQWYNMSGIVTTNSTTPSSERVEFFTEYDTSTIANGSISQIDNAYVLNLTTLNIADLTKDFMDDLYGAYSKTYQAPAFIDKYGVLNAPSFQVTAGLDTAFADLNGLTLREVFEDGNLVSNGTFDINVTGWVNGSGTISWETQTAKTTRNNIVNGGYLQFNTNLNYLTSDKVYVSFDVKKEHNYNAFAGVLYFVGGTPYVTNLNNVYNNFATQSTIITFAGNSTRIQMFVNLNSALSVAEDLIYFYDNIYHVNLTALGINLTKEQMDWYFQLYKTYKGGM